PEPAWPRSPTMAAWLSGSSINPKPVQQPVSQSVMICMVSTRPEGSHSWRSSSAVAVRARVALEICTEDSLGGGDTRSRGHLHSMRQQYRGEEAASHTTRIRGEVL